MVPEKLNKGETKTKKGGRAMDWKELLDGLNEFSKQATMREKEMKEEMARRTEETIRETERLHKEYSSRVEKVIKEFAHHVGAEVGKSWRDKKFPYFFTVHSKEGSHDYYYKDPYIYPSVRIFSPEGIGILIPFSADAQRLKCQKPLDFKLEGYYFWERDTEAFPSGTYLGRICSYVYFIPFPYFTEEKLAAKLIEFYKEALRNYLQLLGR